MRKMLHCVVCGANFEDGVDFCPVCSASKEYFTEYEVDEILESSMKYRLVIIGAGISGVTVAINVRKSNPDAEIILLSREKYLPYNKTSLTKKMFSFELDKELLHSESFYKSQNIKLFLDSRVTKISPNTKELVLQNGQLLGYDRLVIATGANPRSLIEYDYTNIQTIRYYDDVVKILNLVDDFKNVSIIGGGVLGIETANALISKGIKVSLIESASRLMPKSLDEETSEILENHLESIGINLCVGSKVKEFFGDSKVKSIVLEDGTIIETDYIIETIGVKPTIGISTAAGIITDKAIITNEYGETNIKNVYACGDCASFNGSNLCLWTEAYEQARIVANHIVGGDKTYHPQPFPVHLNIEGMSLYSLGSQSFDFETKKVGDQFAKKFIKDGKVVGGILINYDSMIKGLYEETE